MADNQIDLVAALEAVRLGEATQAHAEVLANALRQRIDLHDNDGRALIRVLKERNRLRAVVVAQADARDWMVSMRSSVDYSGTIAHMRWLGSTQHTESLGRELRGGGDPCKEP